MLHIIFLGFYKNFEINEVAAALLEYFFNYLIDLYVKLLEDK